MKKTAKTILVCLCLLIFSTLFLFASGLSDGYHGTRLDPPKAPLAASFQQIGRSADQTALVVELPENHKAKTVILYFGDELGLFGEAIGEFEVIDNAAVCHLDNNIEIPQNATKIWVCTLNEEKLINSDFSIDLPQVMRVGNEDSAKTEPNEEANLEKYAIVAIIVAVVLSSVGYVFLNKGKDEEIKEMEESTSEA